MDALGSVRVRPRLALVTQHRKVGETVDAIQWDGTNTAAVIAFRQGDPALNWVTEYPADGSQKLTLQTTLTMDVTDWLIDGAVWSVVDNATFTSGYEAVP